MKGAIILLLVAATNVDPVAAENATIAATRQSSTSTQTNQTGNTTSGTTNARPLKSTTTVPSTKIPRLRLGKYCGQTVTVTSSPTVYFTFDPTKLWGECTVHFKRPDFGKIQLTSNAMNSNSSLCHVNVLNGYNGSSLSNGSIIQPKTYTMIRQTFTSDYTGQLSVRVHGPSCHSLYIDFFVRKACPVSSSFPCDNGKCVPQSKACDTWNDCGDFSDEAYNCPLCNGFQCNSTVCVPNSFVCDAKNDCGDNSDEKNCPNCPGFRCNNGICVHKFYVCDHNDNCGDNSDEANCNCIPKSYCNGCFNWSAGTYAGVSVGVFLFLCIVGGAGGGLL